MQVHVQTSRHASNSSELEAQASWGRLLEADLRASSEDLVATNSRCNCSWHSAIRLRKSDEVCKLYLDLRYYSLRSVWARMLQHFMHPARGAMTRGVLPSSTSLFGP